MNEALCSILTGEESWFYNDGSELIIFNEDGKGELWCRVEFCYWICAELEWKRIETPVATTQLGDSDAGTKRISSHKKRPQVLGALALEITLTRRLVKRAENSVLKTSTMINEHSLTDAAFQPKSYVVTIEKGNFLEPCYIGYNSQHLPRYVLRLLFDKSPFPPRDQWSCPEGGPDSNYFWDHKEFVGRPTQGLENQGRSMNDVPEEGWKNCIVT